jgi:hypothetical protein
MFIFIFTLINLITFIKAEGYYCPYEELGANGNNKLLYDYYNLNQASSGTYWTRTGQTGWQTVESYCFAKGDTSIHSDAGEWKCNDSKGLCNWDGSSCKVISTRDPDCIEMCRAVLNGEAPDCLGNCPDGHSGGNYLYDRYCNSVSPVITTTALPNTTETSIIPETTDTRSISVPTSVPMTTLSTKKTVVITVTKTTTLKPKPTSC